MFVCCECCVFSGRCLCDELITCPESKKKIDICALKSAEVSFELLGLNTRSPPPYITTLTSQKTIRTSQCIEKNTSTSFKNK